MKQGQVKAAILRHLALPGGRLTHRDVMRLYQCTYPVARHACAKLVSEGLIAVNSKNYPAIFSLDGSRGPDGAQDMRPDVDGLLLQRIWHSPTTPGPSTDAQEP